MNTVLRGSLIQKPDNVSIKTIMPRKESFWTSDKKEHFGIKQNIRDMKKAEETAQNLANSDEAQVTGEVAKGTGLEILRIVKEMVKILASSSAGIAIFSGIILAMEKTLSPEQLFKTTRIIKYYVKIFY